MKRVTLSTELERAADKLCLPLDEGTKEQVRGTVEGWLNDCNEFCEEMSKPEYDSLMPASLFSCES